MLSAFPDCSKGTEAVSVGFMRHSQAGTVSYPRGCVRWEAGADTSHTAQVGV